MNIQFNQEYSDFNDQFKEIEKLRRGFFSEKHKKDIKNLFRQKIEEFSNNEEYVQENYLEICAFFKNIYDFLPEIRSF